MLQNDLFADGTGTGPSKSSMPRAVALERSALAFSRKLALVIRGSATATRTKMRGGGPIGAACGRQRRRLAVQKLVHRPYGGHGFGFGFSQTRQSLRYAVMTHWNPC